MESIAGSLRRRARLLVREDPKLAVERLGFVVVEEYLGRGVKGHSETGSRVIRVAPQPFAPARTYVLLHELMEMALPHHFVGHRRERACQRGAAALLLPSIAYKQSLFRAGWELPVLRRWWPWASWEALGFRVSDIYEWAAFSVWSDHRFRRSGGTEPTELERVAYLKARSGRAILEGDGMAVSAWRLTEPGVKCKVAALAVPSHRAIWPQ